MFLLWNWFPWITCYNRNCLYRSGFVTFACISLNGQPSLGFGIFYSILAFCWCCVAFPFYIYILLGFLTLSSFIYYLAYGLLLTIISVQISYSFMNTLDKLYSYVFLYVNKYPTIICQILIYLFIISINIANGNIDSETLLYYFFNAYTILEFDFNNVVLSGYGNFPSGWNNPFNGPGTQPSGSGGNPLPPGGGGGNHLHYAPNTERNRDYYPHYKYSLNYILNPMPVEPEYNNRLQGVYKKLFELYTHSSNNSINRGRNMNSTNLLNLHFTREDRLFIINHAKAFHPEIMDRFGYEWELGPNIRGPVNEPVINAFKPY